MSITQVGSICVRQLVRLISAALLVMGALVSFPAESAAHRPAEATEDGITPIPNLSTSYAYYESLSKNETLHAYALSGRAGDFLHAGINIPQISGLEDYGVSLALVGPGLPETVAERLPIQALQESQAHAVVDLLREQYTSGQIQAMVVDSQVTEPFYEPFTQTDYWGRQVLELDLPETGTYYLLVWHPDGMSGKYVLDTGYEEVFGPADLFRFPVWWVETRLYFEQMPLLIGIGGFLLIAFLGAFTFRKPRLAALVSAPSG